MPSKEILQKLIDDPATSPLERREAQAQLDASNSDFSERNIFELLASEGCLGYDDEIVRAQYLYDKTTPIEWGRLAFWRKRLDSQHQTLRLFAEQCIKSAFIDDESVPSAVQQAAAHLLLQNRDRKPGDPLPELPIPGKKPLAEMTNEELYYGFMVPVQKRINELFYTPR